jgi:zinc protease
MALSRLLAGALLLAAPMTAAAQGDILPFRHEEKVLANGLKVIVVPTGFPNLVSIQIPVQTGARNEVEPGKSGFAHFFEHMMFRGTPTTSPERYQGVLTKAGARSNAYTADDFTNYHTTFAKEDLETILSMEADRFQNLAYAEEAFKTEARAVLGEYNKNSQDPIRKLLEVQRDHAFTTHTYKHTGMGFIKDIEDMPNQFEYSKTFFQRWYRPEYTTLIVAGDVQPAEVFRLAEKYWGPWKSGGAQPVAIPQEPPAKAPVYAHVPWTSATIPWVTVAFHAPAFSAKEKDYAAIDMLLNLQFGSTSDVYRRLVEQEQKVDQLFVYYPEGADAPLATIFARTKKAEDAVYVRDQLLRTFADATANPVAEKRLEDAKGNARYGLLRSFDNTNQIASVLARYVRFEREYGTLDALYRVYASLTPKDMQDAAQRTFVDHNLVVTTLAQGDLPAGMGTLPALTSLLPAPGTAAPVKTVKVESVLPQLNFKVQFRSGSAADPVGKEGLSALSASMIAEAGSRALRIDEINKALYPMAGSFGGLVDKEMTTFTGVVHRDNARAFLDIVMPQLLEPGFRQEDFDRLRDAQKNGLVQDLRAANEEELGKERLQQLVFAGTRYAHPVLGTVAGLEAITLDDVKAFVKAHYTRGNLVLGQSGAFTPELEASLSQALSLLPAGDAPADVAVKGTKPKGRVVDIVQKETRSTAISLGHPIDVTRSHPDFAALSVARAWLGEHRSSMSHLYEEIREKRGMNYGDYAYIEAFPRGMNQFFPDPNIARRAQLFEIWIRPVQPENAHMALRIAVSELQKLISGGLSEADFAGTREYLMKNVYVMTSTQDQQLGYALDSDYYGIPEYTKHMRDALSKLTRAQVNAAIKKHLSADHLYVVAITKDAEGLKAALVSDAPSSVKYDAPKPELAAADQAYGATKLGIAAGSVTITPVEQVFAK